MRLGNFMKFKDKLKELRLKGNLTQSELAQAIHVSRRTIAKYERGLNHPTKDVIQSLSDYFNVPIEEFMGDEDTAKKNENKLILLISTISAAVIITASVVLAIVIPKYTTPAYNVTVTDNVNVLRERLKPRYEEGEEVNIKIRFFSGLAAGVLLDYAPLVLVTGGVDYDYDLYTFVMPAKDITITTTLNGSTGEQNLIPFSIDGWKNSDYTNRGKMIDSFLSDYQLNGMSRSNVEHYLSTPDEQYEITLETYPTQFGGYSYTYYLSELSLNNARSVLNIRTNQQDVVSVYYKSTVLSET